MTRHPSTSDVLRENAKSYRNHMIGYSLAYVAGCVGFALGVFFGQTLGFDYIVLLLLMFGGAMLLMFGGGWMAFSSWRDWRRCLKHLKAPEERG